MKSFSFNTVSLEEQNVLQRFHAGFRDAQVNIAFRPIFMERDASGQGMSFMPIITHPMKRVVLKPNEVARMHAVHPDPKKSHFNNMILMIGTEYGVIVMHGREKDYHVNGKGTVQGPLPKLHTTTRFLGAALRFFTRTRRGKTSDSELLVWICSDNFTSDIEEQARLDRLEEARLKSLNAHQNLLGDGLPPRIRQQHPVNKRPHDVKGKPAKVPETKPTAKSDVSLVGRLSGKAQEKHPLDILPCRANGFKGTRYADQTPEQRAEGQRMLAQPHEQLSNAEQFVEQTINRPHASGYPAA